MAAVLLPLSPALLPAVRAALPSLAMLRHIAEFHCRHLAVCQLQARFQSAHCMNLLLPAAYKEVKASAKDQKGSKLKLLEVCSGHNLVVTERLVSLDGPASATFFERAEEVEECNVSAGTAAWPLTGCARAFGSAHMSWRSKGLCRCLESAQLVVSILALMRLRAQDGILSAVRCL